MKKLLRLRLWLLALMVLGGANSLLAENTTATINFGSGAGCTNVNSATVTGSDSQGNSWTITTVGTTSFTPQASYSQIGAAKKPAESITFTTTLPSNVTVTSFSAKFGGFNGTEGNVTLKVGDTSVGTGSLNASNDVTVTSKSSAVGNVLTVTVTNISKGVKAYNISYTYTEGSTVKTPIATLKGITPTTVKLGDMDEFTLDATFASTDASAYEVLWMDERQC